MKTIDVYEVGPRDGFQNIQEYIPLEVKQEIIDGLVSAGLRHIQLTSFVSPKAIPQLKDARELTRYCIQRYPGIDFFALVPNLRGVEAALESGLSWVSYVVSLSESHNTANIRRTHGESYSELLRILETYPQMHICLDLATAFGCPCEGKKEAQEVVAFLEPYISHGITQVNLCDTIGIANPAQVRNTITAVQTEFPQVDMQIHIHDTRNMGMVNTLAAIECGVTKVQSTLGGLGGCPYAPGASGNLATEDLAFMLAEMGYDTGIAVQELVNLAKIQKKKIPEGLFSGHLASIQD